MSKITIYWVRHSVSKGNVAPLYKRIVTYFTNSKDVELVNDAEKGSCFLSNKIVPKIKNSRLVCCSVLRRAIQTAILMFPEKFRDGKIKVVPGIAEFGNHIQHPGNTSYDIKTNKKYLIEWCLRIIADGNCPKINKYFKDKKSITKAVNSLYNDLNKKVWSGIRSEHYVEENRFIDHLKPYLQSKGVRKVAIVSHSNYIKKYIMSNEFKEKNKKLLNSKHKLFNNQIFEKEYGDKIREIKLYNMGCDIVNNKINCFSKN